MATKKRKTRKRRKKGKYYVKNSELYEQIVISKENDKLTDEAVDMLIKICNHAVNSLSHKYEEDREDCIATAIMKCMLYWRSFKPELSKNAFSYFTQVAKNGYAEAFNKLRPLRSANVISLSDESIHLF